MHAFQLAIVHATLDTRTWFPRPFFTQCRLPLVLRFRVADAAECEGANLLSTNNDTNTGLQPSNAFTIQFHVLHRSILLHSQFRTRAPPSVPKCDEKLSTSHVVEIRHQTHLPCLETATDKLKRQGNWETSRLRLQLFQVDFFVSSFVFKHPVGPSVTLLVSKCPSVFPPFPPCHCTISNCNRQRGAPSMHDSTPCCIFSP